MSRNLVWLAIACVLASGCATPPPADDVSAYFATKKAYQVEVLRPHDSLFYEAAMKDLESRLRTIIRPDSLGDSTLTQNADDLFIGEPTSHSLDGLDAHVGTAIVLITTPELLAGWLRNQADSTTDPIAALAKEDVMTDVFDADAHAFKYADLKGKVSLPPETFLAQMIARANGDPTGPDEVIIGVRRGRHLYIVLDRTDTLPRFPECGDPYSNLYPPCFDKHVATHPEFSKIATQVKALVARLPER